MFKILAFGFSAILLAACGTTGTMKYDAQSGTWVEGKSVGLSGALGYQPIDRCYIVIENGAQVAELCQEGAKLQYMPGMGETTSIPAEVTGVLAIQGHLRLPS